MENKDKIILHLCCSKYGSDTRDYAAAGYDVRYIGKEIGVESYHPPKGVYGVIANPTCTMFSIARTTGKKPRDLREGMWLVQECLRVIWECMYDDLEGSNRTFFHFKFWALENPATGLLRKFLGKPAYEYQPYEFGEDRSKRTALWGMFNPPPKPLLLMNKSKNVLGYKESTTHNLDTRSIASPQFTKAFFYANQ